VTLPAPAPSIFDRLADLEAGQAATKAALARIEASIAALQKRPAPPATLSPGMVEALASATADAINRSKDSTDREIAALKSTALSAASEASASARAFADLTTAALDAYVADFAYGAPQ
jgi:hypothetical protein